MSLRKIACSILILIVPMLLVGCGAYNSPSIPPATGVARFAFVANAFSNSISSFAVDPQTGQLNPKDAVVPTGGMNSRVMAVEPSGHFAYVGNIVSNVISVFAIDDFRTALMGVQTFEPVFSTI
jgi:6-phosphogluconolactonase (cycloisomerase 2 family)